MGIENTMYFVLGFLIASLLALVIAPSVWKRAVRLTKKRIESASPITMAEFRADKDQLRAEFALSTRQLEMKIGSLRNRLSEQLGEVNANKSDLALLRAERSQQMAIIGEFEEREIAARERILQLEKETADLSQHLRMRDRELADLQENSDQLAGLDTLYTDSAISDIRQALAFDEIKTSEVAGELDAAEAQIANAGTHLDQILRDTSVVTSESHHRSGQSLAEKLLQDEEVERLHELVGGVEQAIISNWNDANVNQSGMRDRLGQIASLVSRLVYAIDSDPIQEIEESLFDRVQKFSGQDLDETETPINAASAKPKRKRRPATSGSVSDRMAAFQDIHANS